MRSIRFGAALAIFMAFCSGCAVHSSRPTELPTTINSTLAPTETIEVVSPAPTAKVPLTATPSPAVETTEAATASPSPISKPKKTAMVKQSVVFPGLFTEENFSEYFHFGMSIADVEQILKGSKVEIEDKRKDNDKLNFLWTIYTENMEFYFDRNNRLYEIDAINCDTANGIHIGDSDRMIHRSYGTEDINYYGQYIYSKNGYYFSIHTFDSYIDRWSVFIDAWNMPNALSGSDGYKMPKGDNSIQFNEDNFTNHFHFGMTRQDIEKELTKHGVLIIDEYEGQEDDESPDDRWVICTEHASFCFDEENHMMCIYGGFWETAKGLKIGDSPEMVRQLYGDEYEVESFWSGYERYIYTKNEYFFSVFLTRTKFAIGLLLLKMNIIN
jgi:hypothetical protein